LIVIKDGAMSISNLIQVILEFEKPINARIH
jgi:hypothetical protein